MPWKSPMAQAAPILYLALAAVNSAAGAVQEGYPESSRAGWGAFVVPVPLEQQAAHDLRPGEGVLVRWVRPGSTADALGIHIGDIVRSINDQPIASRRDIRAIVRATDAGAPVAAQVVTASGTTREISGEFLARRPRPNGARWNGAWANGAPDDFSFDSVVPAQQAELLAEQRALAELREQLLRLRKQVPEGAERAWIFAADLHFPAAKP
jgi:hypothetical protein